ncbi:hypothetical protein BN946_scf185007.g198 [Trametes cinnabarina]|uniref:Uncharacterized protein n=1 Tax=Pycnoporus cinnabarinus TaxID=5643 RepID=A0A060SL26_PYCCI|nr:hypothetical protein BN946_scf185007.g198 [Trametes cinnabarina]
MVPPRPLQRRLPRRHPPHRLPRRPRSRPLQPPPPPPPRLSFFPDPSPSPVASSAFLAGSSKPTPGDSRDSLSHLLQPLASSSHLLPPLSPQPHPNLSLSSSPTDTLSRTHSSSSVLSTSSDPNPSEPLTPPDVNAHYPYACERPLDYYESPPSPPRTLQDQMHVAYALENMHLAKVLLLKLRGIEVNGDDDPRIAQVRDEDFSSSFVPDGGLRLDEATQARVQEAERRAQEAQKRREREDRLRKCERRELALEHARSVSRSVPFSDVLTAMHGPLFVDDVQWRPHPRLNPQQAELLAILMESGPASKVDAKGKAARVGRSSTLDSISSTSSGTPSSDSTVTRSGSWFSFGSRSSMRSSSTALTTPSTSPRTSTKSIILESPVPLSSSPPRMDVRSCA